MTLVDRKILVTGPAGQIAFPLASRLAQDNEVWGIARFSEPGSRERCSRSNSSARISPRAAQATHSLPGACSCSAGSRWMRAAPGSANGSAAALVTTVTGIDELALSNGVLTTSPCR